MRSLVRLGLLLAFASVALIGAAATDAFPGRITLVSVDSGGVQGTGDSLSPAANQDGRYIAFVSWAPNLVTGDTDACELEQPPPQPPITYNCPDIFVRDRQAGTTERVNVSSDGVQANGESWNPAISADGRYVAFDAGASNLVTGDTNNFCQTDPDPELYNCPDIFVRDRQASTTERVNVSSDGVQANGESWNPAISADGRFVAFTSDAFNLVPPNETNGYSDVFVRDRDTDADGVFDESSAVSTERVSVSTAGEANNESYDAAIDADGRYVAFASAASNLVTGDTNGYSDVFVRDRQTGTTERVSVDSSGDEGHGGSYDPSISADGRYVVFFSAASDLVDGDTNGHTDVFVRDRQAVTTTRVSLDSAGVQGNADSHEPAISSDGRYVAFDSDATNLVSGDTDACGEPPNTYNCPDIFVRDRQTSTTARVSVSSGGVQGNGESWNPAVNADGRYVAFSSFASNLVPGDTNGRRDVFVHDRLGTVGGIAELPEMARDSGGLEIDRALLAALAAGAVVLLAAGVWHTRSRFRQERS